MRFHEMTSGQLRQVDREQTLVVLPIAACEQHGPHMPTGTDTIICGGIAGASHHHLPWGATVTLELETYTTVLCQLLQPLLDDGYRRVLLLNGHGGNIDPMRVALRRLQPDYPQVLLTAASYWSIAEKEIIDRLDGSDKILGHACEAETSLVMHLRPDLVDTSDLEDGTDYLRDMQHGVFICQDMAQRTRRGHTGRPDLASPEKGAAMFDAVVARVSEVVGELIAMPLPEPRTP
jgi:creatinine amidohydrolase